MYGVERGANSSACRITVRGFRSARPRSRGKDERYDGAGEIDIGDVEWKGNECSGDGIKKNAPPAVLDL